MATQWTVFTRLAVYRSPRSAALQSCSCSYSRPPVHIRLFWGLPQWQNILQTRRRQSSWSAELSPTRVWQLACRQLWTDWPIVPLCFHITTEVTMYYRQPILTTEGIVREELGSEPDAPWWHRKKQLRLAQPPCEISSQNCTVRLLNISLFSLTFWSISVM
jgi:hypothetical protein